MEKRVLVACEYSQVVTSAFRAAGALAFSCDLEPCSGGHPEWHMQCDVREVLGEDWDLVVAHPPCTYLARSSAVVLARQPGRIEKVWEGARFFNEFVSLGLAGHRVCIENPYPLRVAGLPRWSQVVCPSQFGHEFSKHTCLWLYNLPPILPMCGYYAAPRSWVMHCNSTGKRRAHFWVGIAEAMVAQWLPLL